ncbi:XrtA-associated tyrosine autokinase [Thalassotalea piscium]|uniref:non-specific protein-tyrosine kinase n=1 Tax=Thalassotalea piscium TaxID=1230533 RepID=A0A7X0NEG1_9GAMM|nr:XrtA-associated tyrosine autokinase [Thalassotalea piscium]MBB6541942.1 receptor protein-tyrosine kinase [Thalassotalea piscium]
MSTIEKALQKQRDKANNATTESGTLEKAINTAEVNANVTADVKAEAIQAKQVTPEHVASTTAYTNDNVITIDKDDLEKRGYLVDNGSRKSIKDEFRQIKRKLLTNAFGAAAKTLKHPNLIMVSSSKPNEGKTFVSINLALSIALEQDKTVLLIDADVLRPSINRELGLDEMPGLIEYLLGENKDIGESIYNSNIDKLKVIPAGKPHHLSNELLASDKMVALAEELAQRYPDRVVIFDCPPLIGVSETLVLSSFMGQAILVVEESKTQLADIQKATENLSEDLALGLVVNKAIRSHRDMYGYYGYGYGAN